MRMPGETKGSIIVDLVIFTEIKQSYNILGVQVF